MKQQSLTQDKSSVLYFLTDARNLLRFIKNKNVWHVFNPKTRIWESPTFDISDIYNALPISPKRAEKILKYLIKSQNLYL